MNSKLLRLILASASIGFALGFTKFFNIAYLSHSVFEISDKDWIIQIVAAIMSLGMGIIFFILGPLPSSYEKSKIMFYSGLSGGILLLIGSNINWLGSIWLYIGLIGFSLGMFIGAKNATIPLLAEENNNITTEQVNAYFNGATIFSMIAGISISTYLYNTINGNSIYVGVIAFIVASLLANNCHFVKELEDLKPLKESKKEFIHESINLFLKYPYHLASSSIIWGVIGALVLSITAYVEIQGIGTDVEAGLMSLWAAIGVIIGNFVIAFYSKNKFLIATFASLLISILIIVIPFSSNYLLNNKITSIDNIYYFLSFSALILGILFGIFTNIIDSDFLTKSLEDKKENTAGPLLTSLISILTFIIGANIGYFILNNILSLITQFILLSGLAFIVTVIISYFTFKTKA